jgi:hypothetical protein
MAASQTRPLAADTEDAMTPRASQKFHFRGE